MIVEEHSEIADIIISRLLDKGLVASKSVSASGSVYVYISESRQRIRIADHGKHRQTWFRYNVRTDLKKSREFRISGQRVFFFTSSDLRELCYRITLDFKFETRRNANALIKRRKRRTYCGYKKTGR